MIPDVRLIDANALQRAFDDAHKDEPDFFCCNFLNNAGNPSTEWDCVDDILENATTIDAQPVKRGKWEWEPGYVGTTAKCSACGLSPIGFYSLPIIQIGRLPEYPFCPKCGADMRGDDVDS